MDIDLSAINAIGDGIKWLYRKTGYLGYLTLHYLVTPLILSLSSIVVAHYVPMAEPMSLTQALIYTVVVRFAMIEYTVKTVIRKGTN